MQPRLGFSGMKVLLATVFLLMTGVVACGAASTPASTVAPTAEPDIPQTAPTAAPVQVSSGQELYVAKSCAACHGQEGEGSPVAPALPGHTGEQVLRQVRTPIGSMPAFSDSAISDEELEAIAEFIEGLESENGHNEPTGLEIDEVVAMHHWMGLSAIRSGRLVEAEHHLEHAAREVGEGEHRDSLNAAIEALKAGDLHDAEHDVESMLAGMAEPELSMSELHLQLAISAMSRDGVPDAQHHMGHFLDEASDPEKEIAQGVMDALASGDMHEAETMTRQMLEGMPHQQHRH